MRKYEKSKLTLLAAYAVLTLILLLGTTAVANERTLLNDEKVKERTIVRMAVNVLKLTLDEGTLPDKVEDDPSMDGKNGIRADILPEKRAGWGEYDNGKICLRNDFNNRFSDAFRANPPNIGDINDLIALNCSDFVALVNLAELLLHENTHNQQEEREKKEKSGSDDNIKDCNSHWCEIEAHYAELLFKLKLKKLLGDDDKTWNVQHLIDFLLDKIDARTESVEKTDKNGKDVTEDKHIESSRDLIGGLTIREVYNNAKTLEDKILRVDDWRMAAEANRWKFGEKKVNEDREESEEKEVDPDDGGSLILPGGDAMVMVPSGSLFEPTYIGIHRMDITGLPAGRRTLTPVYEISPGIELNPSSPARLSISISDTSAIPAANIYRWNPNIPGRWVGQWELVDAGRSIDPNGMVSVDTDEFGYFVVIDLRIAHDPCPEAGARDVEPTSTLTWKPGYYAASHDVFFGTDWGDVYDATTSTAGIYRGRQDANSYDPGHLELGQTYYWRIDEVNMAEDPPIWKGDVWKFTTGNYLVVDDFESYTDLDPHIIYETWIDGYSNGTGSIIGQDSLYYVEWIITYGGYKSMPYFYDNDGMDDDGYPIPAYYSEAGADTSKLEIGSDWDRDGVKTLTLYFGGNPDNAPEQMYVALEDNVGRVAVVYYDGNLDDVREPEWHEWNIRLADFTNVDLNNVRKVYIGFGTRGNLTIPGGSGLVFFDELRLYPQNAVTASAGANGSIEPAGETVVYRGNNIEFTATANPGYMVDTWYVDGSVDQTGGNTYTLANITANHTVLVTFTEIPPAIYVNANSTNDPGTGTRDDPFRRLQDGIDAAQASGAEVWVVAGTYRPTTGTDRTISFVTKQDVAIYGGFIGNETDRDQRDWVANQTILSGDIGVQGDNSDNSYHVVVGVTDSTLDGFTITAGNANGTNNTCGGGMDTPWFSRPVVTNCAFIGNSAQDFGGGMNSYDGGAIVTNCKFIGNSASRGGGMFNNHYSNLVVTDCTFIGNTATDDGGGMWNGFQSSPIVTNCTFIGNSARYGGGMQNYYIIYAAPAVVGCTFIGNTAQEGGGIHIWESGPYNREWSLKVVNCTFIQNSADRGGGMFSCRSSPTVTNCTFSNNISPNGTVLACDSYQQSYPSSVMMANCIIWNGLAWLWNNDNSTITISYSDVYGGWAGTGNINADPLFIGSNDLHLQAGSPCIDVGNNDSVPPDYADLDGDGDTSEQIPFDLDGTPRIIDGDGVGQAVVDMGAYEYNPNPFVARFVIVGKERVGRTLFRYTCKVTLINLSPGAIKNVELNVVNVPDNMTIMDSNVTFDYIDAWESVTSDDTCSFEVDRSQAIVPSEVIWQVTYEIADTGQAGQQMSSTMVQLEPISLAGDITGEGKVDMDDLKILAEQWLQPPSIPSADIAPQPSGDSIVNFLDFAELAENWLK